MTGEEHNRYLAFAFLAHGIFQLTMMLFIGLMFLVVLPFPGRPGDPAPPAFFAAFFAVMIFFQLLFTVPSFVAAFALLKRKSWARVASIVAGVMGAMQVPFGTAACAYALWFFCGDAWKSVYDGDSFESRAAAQLNAGDEWQWESEASDAFRFDPSKHTSPPDWR